MVCAVRVAGVVRATSASAAHAVRRCPTAAVNWYSQPGVGLGRALAVAAAVVHVLAARGAPGVRAGVGGRVDGEPQPGPAGARVADLRRLACGDSGQHGVQQAVVDHVVLRDPRDCLRPVDERGQFRRQQGEQLLVVDAPFGEGVVQGAVAAGELRLRAQLHQRGHRVVGAQDRVGQLEQGVRPRVQALVQLLPELPQPLQRPAPRHRAREDRRIRVRAAGVRRQQHMAGAGSSAARNRAVAGWTATAVSSRDWKFQTTSMRETAVPYTSPRHISE